jgi:hypothetical protein
MYVLYYKVYSKNRKQAIIEKLNGSLTDFKREKLKAGHQIYVIGTYPTEQRAQDQLEALKRAQDRREGRYISTTEEIKIQMAKDMKKAAAKKRPSSWVDWQPQEKTSPKKIKWG